MIDVSHLFLLTKGRIIKKSEFPNSVGTFIAIVVKVMYSCDRTLCIYGKCLALHVHRTIGNQLFQYMTQAICPMGEQQRLTSRSWLEPGPL